MDGIYPKALWQPLDEKHFVKGTKSKRNKVVLHITEGSTASGAILWFKTSKTLISVHFVIDRDGTVYQLVNINDTAYHARGVNTTSVGIEHVAIANKLMATSAQYVASAKLVRWLCDELKIPCNRSHILTHKEADPSSSHVLCCTGALDPNLVVSEALSIPPEVLP